MLAAKIRQLQKIRPLEVQGYTSVAADTNSNSPHSAPQPNRGTGQPAQGTEMVALDSTELERGPSLRTSLYNRMQKVALKKAKTARLFLFEAILYVLFVMTFTLVSWGSRSQWAFWMADVFTVNVYSKNYWTDRAFPDMIVPSDFWSWVKVAVLPSLQPTDLTPSLPLTTDEAKDALWYNYLIGRVRFRQLRVKRGEGAGNSECLVSTLFANVVTKCYPEYDSGAEDRTPYGDFNGTASPLQAAFVWRSADDICQQVVPCPGSRQGSKGASYPAQGYVWSLNRNGSRALDEVNQLQALGWVDYQTRVVFVDFAVYNPATRMLLASTAMVEFFPTGMLVATYSNRPLKYFSWSAWEDVALFTGELLLCCAVLAYGVSEFLEMREFWQCKRDQCIVCIQQRIVQEGLDHVFPCAECGRKFNQFRFPSCPSCLFEVPLHHMCWKGYFQDPWNAMEFISQGIFFGFFFCRWLARARLGHIADGDIGDAFFDFGDIAYTFQLSLWMLSLNSILIFLKMAKYFDKVKALSVMVRTLFSARGEIFYFLLLFCVVFLGYSMAFHLAFGTEVGDYKNFYSSLFALFISLLGAFDFNALDQANRVLGPLFFITFHTLVSLIGLTMFIAIVSNSYGLSKEAARTARETFLTSSLKIFFHELYFKLSKLGLLPRNRALIQIKRLIESFLKSRGFSEDQMDDIRTFKTEVDHNPNNTGLFNMVLRAFDFNVDREMKPADFRKLKDAVQQWRDHEPKMRLKVWEEEDVEGPGREEDKIFWLFENSLQLSNPDPGVNVAEVFEQLLRPAEEGGLLRVRRSWLRSEQVFAGSEGVDWVLHNVYKEKPEKSREDALALLSFWTRKGFLEHISCEHPYRDDPDLLYHVLAMNVAEDAMFQANKPAIAGADVMRALMSGALTGNRGDSMTFGTKSLVKRLKRVDHSVGCLFEAASQLDELFDDLLNPDQHGLKAVRFEVVGAKDVALDDSRQGADLHVSVVCGRKTERTRPRSSGSDVLWGEEFILKVRKVQEIILLLEYTAAGGQGVLGSAAIHITDTLEAELKREGSSQLRLLLKDEDLLVGTLMVKLSLIGVQGFRQLARLMAAKRTVQALTSQLKPK